nr:MAG TPA: hypothetical protein [Caudoviricetes sp.]
MALILPIKEIVFLMIIIQRLLLMERILLISGIDWELSFLISYQKECDDLMCEVTDGITKVQRPIIKFVDM